MLGIDHVGSHVSGCPFTASSHAMSRPAVIATFEPVRR